MREIDLAVLRARAAADGGRTWWRGLEELADTDEFRELLHREFPENASEFDDPRGRREFLKLMGASLALAGASACTRIPNEKIIPYVRQPEEIIPGRPLWFATAMPLAGAATPVLVESNMGRPTKVEPNPDHPSTRGGTDVFAQAAILSLYDPDRAQTVTLLGEIAPWAAFLSALQGAVNAQRTLKGAGLRLVTETVISPTLAEQIQQLLADMPQARWIQWDPAGRDHARAGARLAFGDVVEPQYRFDQADVVLSLDADFLVSGPGRLRWSRDFIDRRRLLGGQKTMNRLYVVESAPTPTGIKADHRVRVQAREVPAVAAAIAAALGVSGAADGARPGAAQVMLDTIVKDLQAHRGRSLVLAGAEQPPIVHALAHAMNEALGNVGATVTYTPPVEALPSQQMADLRALAEDMEAGRVDLLVIASANPVYTAPADLQFGERMKKVALRVRLGLHEDETAALCHWNVPETHFLETWSDARAFDGTVSICQPLIAPLYEGCKSPHELVATMAGRADRSAYELVRDFWKRAWDNRASGAWGPLTSPTGSPYEAFEDFWRRSVHDGYIPGTVLEPRPVALRGDALAGLAAATAPATGMEIVFRPDPNVHDGRFANNGWLQELPRPVTKLSWDNVALVSPATAQKLGVVTAYQETDLVTLKLQGRTVRLPVWVVPGQADDSIHVTIGYGRTRAGRVGNGVGADVNALRTTAAPWVASGVEVATNGQRYALACVQGHFAIEGRNHLRAAALGVYDEEPDFAKHMAHQPPPSQTLHGNEWHYDGYAWGMSVDLNACVGCNACVVACVSENNIPVVGKEQVLKQREMHWIRIDRYYTGELDNPQMYFQPMMCQHCETAPCEVVCPVAATVHSSEGLNDMVYNRCVGTRYCSHNCPYKVRRFNFLLYSDWDTPTLKMMRNPNVTVRSRGVMEKCTYCVQRINRTRIDAKREDRSIRDGEIVTACQAACPTEAIVFGNVNDQASRVAKLKAEPRAYGVLAELNTRPRTTYLAAVTNPHPDLAPAVEAHGPAATEH